MLNRVGDKTPRERFQEEKNITHHHLVGAASLLGKSETNEEWSCENVNNLLAPVGPAAAVPPDALWC